MKLFHILASTMLFGPSIVCTGQVHLRGPDFAAPDPDSDPDSNPDSNGLDIFCKSKPCPDGDCCSIANVCGNNRFFCSKKWGCKSNCWTDEPSPVPSISPSDTIYRIKPVTSEPTPYATGRGDCPSGFTENLTYKDYVDSNYGEVEYNLSPQDCGRSCVGKCVKFFYVIYREIDDNPHDNNLGGPWNMCEKIMTESTASFKPSPYKSILCEKIGSIATY